MKSKTTLALSLGIGTCLLCAAASQLMAAKSWDGTFVQATAANTTSTTQPWMTGDGTGDRYASDYAVGGTSDGLWFLAGWDGDITPLISWGPESGDICPTITTTLTGLYPNSVYDISVAQSTDYPNEPGGWGGVKCAITGETMVYYYPLLPGTIPVGNNVYQHKIGTVSGVSSVTVDIDGSGNNRPSFYAGLVYKTIFSSLKGTVAYADITTDPSMVGFVADFTQNGVVKKTAQVFADASGNYTIPITELEGTYDIMFTAQGWLHKLVQDVNVLEIDSVNVTFDVNGDIDGDNEITSTDLSILGLNLGLMGD